MTVTFDREVDHRDNPALLNTKQYTIPATSPYKISLEEVPVKANGVTIAGMTEVLSMPTSTNTFFVDYLLGDIYFHSTNANQQVTPSYWGRGSIVRAADVNKVYDYLERADFVASMLRASAQDTPNRTFKIEAGVFYYASSRKSYAGNSSVNMGPGGGYQIATLTQNYFNKVLFTLDSTGALKKYEGTQAGTKANVTAPAIPSDEIPICMVTVQDDGTGGAGTINNIQPSDIEDLRTLIYVPDIRHRYLTIHMEGFPILGEVFFDEYYFAEDVTIDKIVLSARSAPDGADLRVEVLKNGQPTCRIAVLTGITPSAVIRPRQIRTRQVRYSSRFNRQNLTLANITYAGQIVDYGSRLLPQAGMFLGGRLYQSTALSPLSFTSSDRLGLKVVAVDSGETAEGIEIIMAYS